jgi:hypothetical protein
MAGEINQRGHSYDAAKEAVERSLQEKGFVDMNFIGSQLYESIKFSYNDTIRFLREQGLVYMNVGFTEPKETLYVTSEVYLSGHLMGKLQQARVAAETKPEYRDNVEALEKKIAENEAMKVISPEAAQKSAIETLPERVHDFLYEHDKAFGYTEGAYGFENREQYVETIKNDILNKNGEWTTATMSHFINGNNEVLSEEASNIVSHVSDFQEHHKGLDEKWHDKIGQIFSLHGSENLGKYTVMDVLDNEHIDLRRDDGYRFIAHKPQINENGTIEWAFSTNGKWEKKHNKILWEKKHNKTLTDKAFSSDQIIVSSQAELDKIPLDYNGQITIDSDLNSTILLKNKYNMPVNIIGSSNVEMSNDAEANAYDSVFIVANDNSKVNVYGSAEIIARDDSDVNAFENAKVRASGNASVVANDVVHVTGFKDAKIESRGDSTVDAFDDIKVKARDRSHVNVKESAFVDLYDDATANCEQDVADEVYEEVEEFELE